MTLNEQIEKLTLEYMKEADSIVFNGNFQYPENITNFLRRKGLGRVKHIVYTKIHTRISSHLQVRYKWINIDNGFTFYRFQLPNPFRVAVLKASLKNV